MRACRAVAREIIEGACVSCAATIGTLPAVAWFFGEVPVSGLLANAVAVPLFGFLVLPSMVIHGIACSAWMPAAQAVAPVVALGTRMLIRVAEVSSVVPVAPASGIPGLASCAGLVAAAFLAAWSRWRAAAIAAAASMAIIGAGAAFDRISRESLVEGRLAVFFLDTGMGDAALVLSPGGRSLLVDAGPAHEALGAAAPLPAFLRAWGMRSVDAAVISHGHSDHWGGLLDLGAASMPVRRIVTAAGADGKGADPGWPDLLDALRRGGAVIETVQSCGPLPGLPVEAVVLHPCGPDDRAMHGSENDRSLVLAVGPPGSCVLFTGDMGTLVEQEISGAAGRQRCPVLKVPHHGSAGSSGEELLGLPGLEWAVLSARAGNIHGLPHGAALERIASSGLRLHRVDLDGGLLVTLWPGGMGVRDASLRKLQR